MYQLYYKLKQVSIRDYLLYDVLYKFIPMTKHLSNKRGLILNDLCPENIF